MASALVKPHQVIIGSVISGESGKPALYTILDGYKRLDGSVVGGNTYIATLHHSVHVALKQLTVTDNNDASFIGEGLLDDVVGSSVIVNWHMRDGLVSVQIINEITLAAIEEIPPGPVQWGQFKFTV